MRGDPKRRVTDFEGSQLVTVSNQDGIDEDEEKLPGFFIKLNLLDE